MAINFQQAQYLFLGELIPAYQKAKGQEKEILNNFFVDIENIDESKLSELSDENQKIVQQLIEFFKSDDMTLGLRRKESGKGYGILSVFAMAVVDMKNSETLQACCEYSGKAVDIE